MSKMQIIKEILKFMKTNRGQYSEWYVGITKDVKSRLIDGHKLDEVKDISISFKANSTKEAREIENSFLILYGTDGGPGGGNIKSDMVYAYKKSSRTEP